MPQTLAKTIVQNSHNRLVIRRATLNDVSIIAHHRAAMFLDMGVISDEEASYLEEASKTHLSNAMACDKYFGWLIECDAAVVAGGGIILRELLPRPNCIDGGCQALIINIYTEPPFRRRSLARKIMATILSWCQEQRIKSIVLHASDQGRPLYQSMGFVPTNEMRLEV